MISLQRRRRRVTARLALIIAAGSRPKLRETDDGQKSMVSLRRERLVSGHRRIVFHRSSHAEDRRRRCGCRGRGSRMVSEKIEAGLALQALALPGGLGLTASSAATRMLTRRTGRKLDSNRSLLVAKARSGGPNPRPTSSSWDHRQKAGAGPAVGEHMERRRSLANLLQSPVGSAFTRASC